ncbi:hypothetical protein [Streptomyces sp. NK15101]|uniref:hypothetical protein n=1 Tax=Streptomyces sp. NK15101 TaxID=2873261 RepID=UPI001CEDB2A5|nr:hypothetical protein [Streptomyces sp. NK15101]
MSSRRAFPEVAASWVPAGDERRLAVYKLLAAYANNQVGESPIMDQREDRPGVQ